LIIIRDTREKNGWNFIDYDASIDSTKLDVGDYAIKTYENKIAIERKKGISELYNNISPKNRERFLGTMARLIRTVEHPFMVIEANLGDLFYGVPYSKISPNYVFSVLLTLQIQGLNIIWAGNRGEEVTYLLLKKYIDKCQTKPK